MLAGKPGRNRIGRSSNDHLDASLIHSVKQAIDMAEVEYARFGQR
jgi:hypothetical protein